MSLYSRLDRLAADVEKLNRQVTAVANSPQSQRTSVEGGSIDFNDADGNLMAIMGGQDDGSNTIRHVDGPVPPIPSGLSAHVDGPIVQVSWDGTFEDADEATYDWSHLEVVAVGPNNENLRATINDVTGATANLAATASGEWTVAARSVSRAEKRSLDGDAGTVEVKLVDIDGAIEAVQDSANGKNKVTYSSHAPTENDPGIFDDTWFVGQVGRPNDLVEATNLVFNPSFEVSPSDLTLSSGLTSATQSSNAGGVIAGNHCLEVTGAASGIAANTAQIALYTSPGVSEGDYLGWGWSLATSEDLTVSVGVNWYNSGGSFISSEYQSYRAVPTGLERMSSAFLAPDGTYRARMIIRFRAANGTSPAPSSFKVLTDGWSAVPAQSEQSALAAAATFFDGDTEDGATDNESHYRWTGTPHASTSEKYLPALDIGESSNWNIIEQYRHDGNGWVKVELSHYVFSTVDLGKATVGELDGIRIMAKTISGDLFTGDAFDGIVFRGNTFTTRDGNGEFSDRGLFFQKPDGTAIFRVPTDGRPISMSASDVQIERGQVDEVDLNVGRVRSGGLLELSSGVTPPASPPELNSAWKRHTTLPGPEEDRAAYANLAYWGNGNKWVRMVNVPDTSTGDRAEIYDYNTGAVYGSFPLTINPTHGVTIIGDVVYVLGSEHGILAPRVFVHGYDLNTGDRVTRWEYTRNYQAKNPLGNDGVNLIVASVYNRELWVHRRNPSTGVQVGSDMRSGANSWPASGGTNLYGVRITGDDVEVVASWGGRVYTSSNNVLTRKSDSANSSGYAGWVLPTHDVSGCAWVSGVPYPVDSSGVVLEGAAQSSDYAAEVCFTWYDGTYETTPSPVASINVAARETVTISLPYREGLQKRVYTREGLVWRRNTLAPETTVADIYTGLIVPGPPTTNSFPTAAPAVLKSTNDKFEVKGDGSGRWGPITWNSDGTIRGATEAGEVIVPINAANSNRTLAVTFTTGRFKTPPTVVATPVTPDPQTSQVSVNNITATGFTMVARRTVASDAYVRWVATEG